MTDTGVLSRQILELTRKHNRQQIDWRRHLHQYPELSDQEFETTKFLAARAREIGLTVKTYDMPTGFVADLVGKTNKSKKTVAVRTDIDALPILEQTNLPFTSKNEGCMHACGHDVHMSTVLGTAAVLNDLRDQFDGTIRFLFQPSEEMPPGGAREFLKRGALEGVSMIFGLHVDPHLATGKISVRDGETMGAVMDFDIVVHGVGGHAARPQNAVDAIVAAAAIIDALQKVVSREMDPIAPVAITCGKISGGTARNVIADRVELTVTARTLSADARKKLPKAIKRAVINTAKAHGAAADIEFVADYPVVINDPAANRIIVGAAQKLLGKGKVALTEQVLGGEDFACYLEKIRGAMFRLGVRNTSIGADKSWHSPKFIVDEDAISVGTAVMVQAAIDALRGTGR